MSFIRSSLLFTGKLEDDSQTKLDLWQALCARSTDIMLYRSLAPWTCFLPGLCFFRVEAIEPWKGFWSYIKRHYRALLWGGCKDLVLQQAETTFFFFSRRMVNRSSFEIYLLLEHKEKRLKMVPTESQINKLENTDCTYVIINSIS